jgi:hypothetical protein
MLELQVFLVVSLVPLETHFHRSTHPCVDKYQATASLGWKERATQKWKICCKTISSRTRIWTCLVKPAWWEVAKLEIPRKRRERLLDSCPATIGIPTKDSLTVRPTRHRRTLRVNTKTGCQIQRMNNRVLHKVGVSAAVYDREREMPPIV